MLALFMLVICSMPLTVFADDVAIVSVHGSDVTKMAEIAALDDEATQAIKYNTSNGEFMCIDETGEESLWVEIDSDGSKITFYYDVFETADKKSRKEALGNFIGCLNAYKVSDSTIQNISDRFGSKGADVQSALIQKTIDGSSAD
jgi:hypothetical protein